MPVRRSFFGLAALCLVALVSCASDDLATSVAFDPLTQFPEQGTFSWDDAANKLPSDDRVAALDLDPLIREAANAEFGGRGYRMVTGAADYKLSYQLAVDTWIGPDNSKSIASLSLRLAETKTDRRVWLGYGRAEMHVSISRDERLKRLREATSKMLENFPPR